MTNVKPRNAAVLLIPLGLLCFLGVMLSFNSQHLPVGNPAVADDPNSKMFCDVTIQLTENSISEKQIVAGLLRVTDSDGNLLKIPELLNRGRGLIPNRDQPDAGIHGWHVMTQQTKLKLPREKLTFEAFSGIETELSRVTVDLSEQPAQTVSINLNRLYDRKQTRYRPANTHLHIMKFSRAECDRYLREVPQADRLDMLFVSHLERAVVDQTYITNRYSTQDLQQLTKESGVMFGWGEEHRHNTSRKQQGVKEGYGEGYGHVMLLNIQKLIQPVSIGPGIMKQGTDGIPLARGIRTARKDGATVIWCHNAWGREATPNFVRQQVDALNIFDGGTRSSYEDSFYRYLNAGLRVPFSTGTDWYQYDFSRVYAKVDGPLTIKSWLQSLRQGKTFITNGPLLSFEINGLQVGETIALRGNQQPLQIKATATGRVNFKQLELVHNGVVVAKQTAKRVGGHFEASFNLDRKIVRSGWLAIRTPSPSVPGDKARAKKTPLNEYGRELFAHSSPIYVEVHGRKHFDRTTALELLTEMQTNREYIAKNFKFADDHERAHVIDEYSDAIDVFQKQIAEQGRE